MKLHPFSWIRCLNYPTRPPADCECRQRHVGNSDHPVFNLRTRSLDGEKYRPNCRRLLFILSSSPSLLDRYRELLIFFWGSASYHIKTKYSIVDACGFHIVGKGAIQSALSIGWSVTFGVPAVMVAGTIVSSLTIQWLCNHNCRTTFRAMNSKEGDFHHVHNQRSISSRRRA